MQVSYSGGVEISGLRKAENIILHCRLVATASDEMGRLEAGLSERQRRKVCKAKSGG